MSLIHYRVEMYGGHPSVLAEELAPMGIEMRSYNKWMPTVEYEDRSGVMVREVGEVGVYPDGKIVAWPRSNACERGIVYVLRTAERVLTYGVEDDWAHKTKPDGTPYRRTTVLMVLKRVRKAATAAERQRFAQKDAIDLTLGSYEVAPG